MFDRDAPPVMRGDLFSLLDPEVSDHPLGPADIAAEARRLAEQVTRGDRVPGTSTVMACLDALTRIDRSSQSTAQAFRELGAVRARLIALGEGRGHPLPWRRLRERSVVLPQRRAATVIRVVPCDDGYFALLREAQAAEDPVLPELDASGLPDGEGGASGPAHIPPVDVTYRLFRFGREASDVRLAMRIIQESGTYRPVLCDGDGRRVALISRDIVGVFDADGKVNLSGRVPLDMDADAGAEITSMALEGDILAINMRSASGRSVELAMMNLAQKRGLPIGVVGEEASAMVLAERHAFVVDGLNLLRVPLLIPNESIAVFRLRPWFAEHPYCPSMLIGWDDGRVWISNGRKLVIVTEDLEVVLAELTLPEPIVDLHLGSGELVLVTHDPTLGVAAITVWDVS